jgi:hypothetical protein
MHPIQNSYFHSVSTHFNKLLNLVRDQILYLFQAL